MKNAARIKWLSKFDMETLVSSVLGIGTQLCLGCAIANFALQQAAGWPQGSDRLQAAGLPMLFVMDLRRVSIPALWPRLLLDAALAILMLTPYCRVLASMFYMTYVERDRKQMVFIGFVLTVLTVLVLTDLV